MTVRKSLAITFTPGEDFFRTDRGVTWGVKVTDFGDLDFVSVFVKSGDVWVSGIALTDADWENEMQAVGDIKRWFVEQCLPKLNEWLAATFKPGDTKPPALGLPEQLDGLIVKQLRVTVNADGTLTASMD